MNKQPDIPELLAPAGSIEAGIAAFDAGADAVYAGLAHFNARERGKNFTIDEMSKLIAYAHKNNRKVYVTLNTLIKESELPTLADLLRELNLLRPDAIIVQDLGVIRMIREVFPNLVMHASTQMAIHNSSGVNVAESMGIKRVILERQVTFEEISEIQKNSNLELEIFVHGALCCGRSGSCLFSSWMGGWSGNRGKCKQPCRRRYFSKDGNGFFFSTKDLYSLEDIPAIKKMGIKSLKIEGRLRGADYVHSVVSAYREVLDAPEGQIAPAIKRAKGILAGAPGRRWTTPFRADKDFKNTIQHTSLGASGLLCGSVMQAGTGGFLMDVMRTLQIDDRIRIQPQSADEGPAITITKMTVNKKKARHTKRGDKCWIFCDKTIEPGSLVFKTGHEHGDITNRIKELPSSRIALDLDVSITKDSVAVSLPQINQFWKTVAELQPARSHPLDRSTVCDQFVKSDASVFRAGNITTDIADGLFLPAAQLKQLRKTFWKWAQATLDPDMIKKAGQVNFSILHERLCEPLNADYNSQQPHTRPLVTVKTNGSKKVPLKSSFKATSIRDLGKSTDEAVLPEFCSENRLCSLKKMISRVSGDGIKHFRATAFYALDILPAKKEIHLTAGFPLPICNSLAMAELVSCGIETATAWVELTNADLKDLIKVCGKRIEVFKYGKIPILTTRMHIPVSGKVTDKRGAKFEITKKDGLTYLYPSQVLSIKPPKDNPVFMDLSHAKLDEKAVTTFNQNRDWA